MTRLSFWRLVVDFSLVLPTRNSNLIQGYKETIKVERDIFRRAYPTLDNGVIDLTCED